MYVCTYVYVYIHIAHRRSSRRPRSQRACTATSGSATLVPFTCPKNNVDWLPVWEFQCCQNISWFGNEAIWRVTHRDLRAVEPACLHGDFWFGNTSTFITLEPRVE